MQRKTAFVLTFLIAISLTVAGCSKQEESSSGEHPESEHPPSEAESTAESGQPEEINETKQKFLTAVENYINDTLENDGTLPVERLDGSSVTFDGTLSLKKIHRKKAVTLDKEKGKYFVCSDFVETTEDGKETAYDFDFIMHKHGDSFHLDRLLLHKKNGKELIKWKDGKPVPAGKHEGSAAGDRSSDEHPDEGDEHPEEDGDEHPEEDGGEHPEEDGSEHPEEDGGDEHPEEDEG